MPLLNALSVPRGLATFPRKWLRANCLATDSVGDCVYVTGNEVGGLYQVSKADPTNWAKMPAVGVITSKRSPTECRVQFLGEIQNVYTGLTVRNILFVAVDGRLSPTPPAPAPGGYAFVQPMGTVLSSARLMIMPNFSLTKRVG